MPFPDGSFDVVLSLNAVHVIAKSGDREEAIREILRVLRPGGQALIGDVRCLGEYVAAFAKQGCDRIRLIGPPWGIAFLIALITWGAVRPGAVLVRKGGWASGENSEVLKMSAAQLLEELHAHGFTLSVGGDRVRVNPASRLTPELRQAIVSHRTELLTLLAGAAGPARTGDAAEGVPAPEMQRLAAQARLGWDKEASTLSRFGLKDGMSVLEVGSGLGFITGQLLELLPHGTVTGLENGAAFIQQAERYLRGRAEGRVRFVEASIMDTRLPEDSFDFAYARLVFQHLPDPVGAAREVRRVLKPGGKLVIYDVDDDLLGLFDPPAPEFASLLQKFGQAQGTRGGDRRVGRRLWRILKAAGFEGLDLEAIAVHSDAVGIEAFLPQMDPDRLSMLVKAGLISQQEFQDIRSACERFLASPEPYIMWLSLLACGEKPGTTILAEA
jgi:ubiquinone/menaquinone biosynthesis C-methylase UbiE